MEDNQAGNDPQWPSKTGCDHTSNERTLTLYADQINRNQPSLSACLPALYMSIYARACKKSLSALKCDCNINFIKNIKALTATI